MSQAGAIVLESGRVFRGTLFGAIQESIGEVVFNTCLSGYQEVFTDPSYRGQIITMTAPQIGNVGVNQEDMEGQVMHAAGVVVRENSPLSSNWRSEQSLEEFLRASGKVGLEGVDTRALTRAIREQGAMRAAITPDVDNVEAVLERVRQAPSMAGQDLALGVSCKEPFAWTESTWHPPELRDSVEVPEAEFRVVAVDFGAKRNILRELRAVGCQVTVVPADSTAKDILARRPDGVFLSNGPGDPAAVGYAIDTVRELCVGKLPIFGICLGHQILALALGARTYKLPFGHHGGNHPVKDLQTGKVEITSQNHGFAVEEASLPDSVRCTHINLYDSTVEGIEVMGKPVFGIQYHPEAAPGPHDASYLFQRFADRLRAFRA